MEKQQNEYLNDLKEIRSLMEQSSKFISLSGISGILAGIIALLGASFAYFYLRTEFNYDIFNIKNAQISKDEYYRMLLVLISDAIIVLTLSISVFVVLSSRKAKKNGHSIWDNSVKQLLINLFVPLATGGILCLIFIFHNLFVLVAPATLIFYGLALFNASKFTLRDIKYLGLFEILLGLASSFFLGLGFLFWIIGFGLLHIVYGSIMYFKYDRNNS